MKPEEANSYMSKHQKIMATKVTLLADLIVKVARSGRQRVRRTISLCRFWLHDFWLDHWDHYRRTLLFKHYWSYIRYPPIPTKHIPEPRQRSAAEEEQIAFSAAFRNKIEYVQARATTSNGVYLTFRPIGKNLRLLGTALRDNVSHHRMTFIKPGGPPTEERMLSLEGHQWNPWLWSRSVDYQAKEDECRDTARAWSVFFKHPSINPTAEGDQVRPHSPRLRLAYGPFNVSYLERVLEIAATTKYVFSPVESMLLQAEVLKQKLQWPGEDEQVLGVHVRRGDAATSDSGMNTPQKANRKSFPLSAYLDAADVICSKYQIRHIYLATESTDDIDRAKQLRPQYKFLFLEHDRSIFPNIASSNQFIEYLALEHPERIRALTMSAILDLYFFCECHAFLGTFNSEFSLLAWLLAIGTRGHVVPYVSLSKPARQRSLDPFQALLNVKNNCLLELYHW
jgi:hypothetical protein